MTGQVSASFDETPQLPFEVLELKLKNGPRAPLATPQTCGTKVTQLRIRAVEHGRPGWHLRDRRNQRYPERDERKVRSRSIGTGKAARVLKRCRLRLGSVRVRPRRTAAARGSNQLSVSLLA